MGIQISTHQPCNDCGSTDALTVYDWGSKCYSCKKLTFLSSDVPKSTTQSKPEAFKAVEGESKSIISRKIGKPTVDFYGLTISDNYYHFPYHDSEGNLVAYKKRQVDDKKFSITGSWGDGLMFGESLFPAGQDYVTLTEGELDALSAWQMLGGVSKYSVLSVRNGAGSAVADCKKSFEYIDSFANVIICFDSDAQGQDAARAVADLFGSKARIFKPEKDFKDASDYLQSNRGDFFVRRWWQAERYIPEGIIDGSTLWDEVNKPIEKSLVNYPYKGLNELTYGIRPHELVLCTAGSGLGKSQFMREMVFHILNNTQDNIGLMFLEESVRTTARSMMSLHANKLLHLPNTKATDQEIKESFDATLGTGRLFLLDHFGSSEVDRIVAKVKYMAKALECKYIFLDHVSIVVASQEFGDERKNIDEIMTKLRILVQETGISLFAVSHLKRPDGKGHEEGAVTSMSQLRGSQSLGQIPNMIIGLERNGQAANEEDRHTTKVRVLKNRFCGMTGPACNLLYNRETGRMIEKHDEDAL